MQYQSVQKYFNLFFLALLVAQLTGSKEEKIPGHMLWYVNVLAVNGIHALLHGVLNVNVNLISVQNVTGRSSTS